jgi:putative hemolysin
VFSGNPERIDGVVHAKEVARRLVAGEGSLHAYEIMRPIATVPESMRAERLVTELRRQQSEQAIVVDEHGGVAGLVTLEDLLTEVLGDSPFADGGSDTPEQLPDGRLRLPGRTRVDEAHEWLGVLWDGESDTVGGMVQEVLGHIPDPGERLVIDGVEVEVEAVDQFTVRSLLVKPLRPHEREGAPR